MNILRTYLAVSAIVIPLAARASAETKLYETRFSETKLGRTPDGWVDLIGLRPSRGWAIDGNGFLRATLKGRTGLIAYEHEMLDGQPADALGDCTAAATFKKTEDDTVSFGIAARIQPDAKRYYLARFRGNNRLELIKVTEGGEQALDFMKPATDVPTRPTGLITLVRYRHPRIWKLSLTVQGDLLSARVFDESGMEAARLDARDADYARGKVGVCATRFAAAETFRVDALQPVEAKITSDELAKRNAQLASSEPDYPIVNPYWKTDELNTPRDRVQGSYDVIIAGAGTGGCGAGIQAARMDARVLMLEETDWIGGQMCSAAVPSMDESGIYGKFPVRERGIYREFHESITNYYHTIDKDPFVAYFSYPDQVEGGYEPKAARAVLYGLIDDARKKSRGGALDVSVRSRIVEVRRSGDTVTGVVVEFLHDDGSTTSRKEIACKVLIDSTEYGDVIPLTGARYRTGNATSDKPNPAALVQDHTWTIVLREYPGGVPEGLKIKSPPPGYEGFGSKRWKNYKYDGFVLWGGPGKGIKGTRSWRVYFAWRGMADADSPLIGEDSWKRHTQCAFNGGNDYPVTSATLEDSQQRLKDEREGIHRSLQSLYYFQHEVGVNWSVAVDEGYDTPYNRAHVKKLDLRPDLAELAVHMPQQPYVRESRRVIAPRTLVAKDLTRFEEAKLFATSVAMGDYFMDLDHGKTSHAIEPDLDPPVAEGELPRGSGPFQVPFEVFIPEKIDGFVPAEKNFAQSRLANGATRLQPITMLTGQAAGAIAAIAVKSNVQPRAVDPKRVQRVLLDAGCTLIQRWYSDVAWATPVWEATQLLSLYQVMDRPGPITRDATPLGAGNPWGVSEPLKPLELAKAMSRLAELKGISTSVPSSSLGGGELVSRAMLRDELRRVNADWASAIDAVPQPTDASRVTAGEFAVLAARILAP
jgi:hypothetical protein